MVKIFRPHRGSITVLQTKNPVLAAGELVVEYPDSGVGTGIIKMKMGDGVTPWNDLPYAVDVTGDVGGNNITFEESEKTDNTELLNEISTGNSIGSIFGAIKTLLSNLTTTLSTHTHDDRYYQKEEVDNKLADAVTYDLSGTTLTITTKS